MWLIEDAPWVKLFSGRAWARWKERDRERTRERESERQRERNMELQRADGTKHWAVKFTNPECFLQETIEENILPRYCEPIDCKWVVGDGGGAG